MKEVKKYMCELCFEEYENKEDAEKCEKFHARVKKINSVQYSPMAELEPRPDYIRISFNDGKDYIYRRYQEC